MLRDRPHASRLHKIVEMINWRFSKRICGKFEDVDSWEALPTAYLTPNTSIAVKLSFSHIILNWRKVQGNCLLRGFHAQQGLWGQVVSPSPSLPEQPRDMCVVRPQHRELRSLFFSISVSFFTSPSISPCGGEWDKGNLLTSLPNDAIIWAEAGVEHTASVILRPRFCDPVPRTLCKTESNGFFKVKVIRQEIILYIQIVSFKNSKRHF